ncbi:MAG: DUF1844 domain-containing protein [Desulfofustis sp.]|nr:DUF1844 domain-containing protein [Desulfofustis sp.]MBT8347681.1 DUF1844 domain-containing protein [Desulfofustis sp.]NNF46150.1 DUF1844 domain-containing protein [Desulfofustis sp.]NNK12687.1 DUF1844 domain-containing protein [Desulfofustis sp.]NNK55908.1 DUF1844 domain-containing protein [Desulfofustis sp.]
MTEEKNSSNVCGEGEVPDKEGRCVMPEVTFSTFVMSLNTSVLYHLGELPDPESGEKFVNLDLARHAIDTLVVLEQKTKGNLTDEEAELMRNILYDVKMRFVNAVKH